MDGIHYATIRQLFFVVPVTIFTIVLLFVNTGVGIICFIILVVTAQLASLTAFHQRASHWRDSVDGVLKEIFAYLFKVGLKKKATKTRGLCQREAKKLANLIVRDFVRHWYSEFSDDEEFPNDVLLLLEHLAIKMEDRCRAINIEELLADMLPLVTAQLRAISTSAVEHENGIKKLDFQSSTCVKEFVYNHPEAVHSSLLNYDSECRHIKSIVDLLFETLLPVKYKHCEAGRMFVREVLTCRVVLPTINQLCNSDFLCQAIVHLLSPSNPDRIADVMRQIDTENSGLDMARSSQRQSYAPYMSRTIHKHHHKERHTHCAAGMEDEACYSWEENSFEKTVAHQSPISVVGYKYVERSGGFVGYIIQFPMEIVEEGDSHLVVTPTSPSQMARAFVRYSRFEKLHTTLNKPPLSRFLQGIKLPEKKSFSSLLHKVTSRFDDPEFLQDRKAGLEIYLKSLWQINEIRSSGLLRQFLSEGVTLYKTHYAASDDDGEDINSLVDDSEVWETLAAQQTEEVAKPNKVVQRMLSNYLYIHLPLNTTTLPVLSLNADSSTSETMPVQPVGKQQPVSMATALMGAGRLPDTRSRSSTGSEDSMGALTSVTASSDRRHFWTDNMSASAISKPSVDAGVRVNRTNSSSEVETKIKPSSLSFSTPSTPTFLSRTPPLSDATSGTLSTSATVPTTPTGLPVTSIPTPSSSPTEAVTLNSSKSASGWRSYISNILWHVYQFLLTLFKASFVPVSGRMITLLAKEQEVRSPLSNALLCFVTEVTSKTMDKPWLCNERLQLGVLSLFGKQLDRYILDLLLTVTEDEVQWCRAMFYLRNMFWPGGQFDMSPRKQLSEQERTELQQQTIEVVKQFLPAFFGHLVGQEDYDKSIKLCLACLENSQLNRHLTYKILDVLIAKMVPEISQSQFKDHLLLHRTHVINS